MLFNKKALKKVTDSEEQEQEQILQDLKMCLECQKSTQKSIACVQGDITAVLELLNRIRRGYCL